MALGLSNIQEGVVGRDGFARNGFQSLLGQSRGDLAFGLVNLGAAVGGLSRPVLSSSVRPLFRTIPSDFVPAYTEATRLGLGAEFLSSGLSIYDTANRIGQ